MTGDAAFKDKIRTVGVGLRRGSTKTTVVRDERDGRVAGRQIEHWNDRVDAVVTPKTHRVKLSQED